MLQSRTVRTLTTLFSAMTIGALSLMWMETAPIDELPLALSAHSSSLVSDGVVVNDTHVPIKQSKWKHVILLSAPSSDHETARASHFIVADGKVTATTELWKRQVDGYHTFALGNDWNADSIGVCFVGDLTDAVLNTRQFNELMSLVQRLQYDFKIRPERVYLHSELDDRTERPSGLFVRTFAQRLLQSQSR